MRYLIPVFLLVWFPFLADAKNVTAVIDETHPLSATGEVEVANINGAVTIVTWDKAEVSIHAEKEAPSEADLKALEVKIEATPDRVFIHTIYLNKDGSWLKKFTNTGEVRYTITVPHTATLKKVETVNGPIEITGVHGRVTASSVNGRIGARGLRNEVEMSAVNGGINVDFATVADMQDIRLEAVNGTVDLVLPDNVSASIKASAVNGRISNEFGLAADNSGWIGHDLDGRLGTGGARIKLHTVNGAIKIAKRSSLAAEKSER